MSNDDTTSSTPSSSTTTTAKLIVGYTKDDVQQQLCAEIIRLAQNAISERDKFTIALSGGSLPKLLSGLIEISKSNHLRNVREWYKWDKWYILLADERVVPLTDNDSNLGSIHQHFLDKIPIPSANIIGIDQSIVMRTTLDPTSTNEYLSLDDATTSIATDYESKFRQTVLSTGMLDLAVLGFGPDGHTCSLFPNHDLLKEHTKLVAPIHNSPKLPPHRITLTFPVLNAMTRNVIVCGTGSSKYNILKDVFMEFDQLVDKTNTKTNENTKSIQYSSVIMTTPPPYPCAMVRPIGSDSSSNSASGSGNSGSNTGGKQPLTWIVDTDALTGGKESDKSSST